MEKQIESWMYSSNTALRLERDFVTSSEVGFKIVGDKDISSSSALGIKNAAEESSTKLGAKG